jgi:protein-L-isoaspartate(D-aspartate) O-methyltransferase
MTDFAERRRMMVDSQVRPSDVTRFPIIEAMLTIPRERYVPDSLREAAYVGEHLPLGPGRIALDPRTLAKMIEALDLDPADVVLVIAPGHGYSAAVIGHLVDAVIALEEDAGFAAEAEAALAAEGAHNVAVVTGRLADGAPQHGPYDAILIEGGIETLPDGIAAQLKDGGRIACLFQEGPLGTVRIGHRHDGRLTWRHAFNAGAPVLPGFSRPAAFAL